MKAMSKLEIYKSKAHYNKWLNELTTSETELIFDMMEEYAKQQMKDFAEWMDINVKGFADDADGLLKNGEWFIYTPLSRYKVTTDQLIQEFLNK